MLYQLGSPMKGAGVVQGQSTGAMLSQGDISHVLIMCDSYATVAKLSLSVSLQTAQGGNEVLLGSVPCFPLAELCGLEGHEGNSLSAYLEKFAEASPPASDEALFAFKVPIGQIHLSGQDQLQVSVNATTGFAASDGVTIAALDTGTRPESLIRYVSKTNNASFSDVEAVYAYRIAGATNELAFQSLTLGDVDVSVKAGNDAKHADLKLYGALSQASGSFEVSGPRRTALVYHDKHGTNPGADVSVSFSTSTGSAELSSWAFLAVERIAMPGRAQRKAREVGSIIAGRIEQFEASKPELARAALAQGRIVPSAQIRGALRARRG